MLSKRVIYLSMLLLAVIMLSGAGAPNAHGSMETSTRGVGEEIRMEVVFQLIDPLTSVIVTDFEIYSIMIDGVIKDQDELRSAYASDPQSFLDSLGPIMQSRSQERLEMAVDGAVLTLTDFRMDPSTLENSTSNIGQPVSGTIDFRGDIPPEEIIPEDHLSSIGAGRLPFVMGALFKSGFAYSRSYTFSAGPGESVKYILPSNYDLLGDGSVLLLMEQRGEPVPSDNYTISLSGGAGTQVERYSFMVRASDVRVPEGEQVEGIVTIDMPGLDTAAIRSTIRINSVGISKTSMFDDLPPGMESPSYLGSGTIRYLALEGLIDADDLDEAVQVLVQDAERDLGRALDSEVSLEAALDLSISGEDPPLTGAALVAMMGSDESMALKMDSADPVKLNLTRGYDPEDVMGLLNGGLVIRPEFDRALDDRYEVHVVLPEGLMIRDRDPLENVSGRRSYELPYGSVAILSDRAPELNGSDVSLSGAVDMSRISSIYIVDADIQLNADLMLMIGHVEIDPADYDLALDMDIELDHLTSDLVRLMVKMGVLSRLRLDNSIRDDLYTFLSDLVPEREDIRVDLHGSTLDFDGDRLNVNGDEPLLINITVKSRTSVLDPALGREGSMLGSAFLPYHLDPVVPMRAYKRSIPLGEASDWKLDLSISFPSGVGVRGNLGNGGDHYHKALETRVDNGIPTLVLSTMPGEGDHIYLELDGGAYFAYNNVSICFFGVALMIGVIALFVLVKIGKAISKNIKKRKTVNPKVKEGDLDPNSVLKSPDTIDQEGALPKPDTWKP